MARDERDTLQWQNATSHDTLLLALISGLTSIRQAADTGFLRPARTSHGLTRRLLVRRAARDTKELTI
jgi:hypothetical protein